jgi:general secretion pathway protein D
MTLDNLSAFVQRGSSVPYSAGQTVGVGGQATVNTQFADVGLILFVTPRVTPDGLIVMEVDAENSSVTDFIPVGGGGVAPQIDLSRAQTTVSARSGQTVILGGIIAESNILTSRRIPYISDLPVLGNLFRYDSQTQERRELMIILTPHVVNNEYDMERIKQAEFARMNWCLADLIALHGDIGGNAGHVLAGPELIYPQEIPLEGEIHPVPESDYLPLPADPGMLPAPDVLPPPGAPPYGAPLPGTAPSPPPGSLPLYPPGSAASPALDFQEPRDSSRRMESAYAPPPRQFPVAPAGYQGPAPYPPVRR